MSKRNTDNMTGWEYLEYKDLNRLNKKGLKTGSWGTYAIATLYNAKVHEIIQTNIKTLHEAVKQCNTFNRSGLSVRYVICEEGATVNFQGKKKTYNIV